MTPDQTWSSTFTMSAQFAALLIIQACAEGVCAKVQGNTSDQIEGVPKPEAMARDCATSAPNGSFLAAQAASPTAAPLEASHDLTFAETNGICDTDVSTRVL